MSPNTPERATGERVDALARVLDCPLNDPAWVEAARRELMALTPLPTLADFSAARPLPRLSAVFDAAFYLERNQDVARAGTEPYLHFLEHGLAEGRDPHPLVDLAHIRTQRGEEVQDPLDPGSLAAALADPAVSPHPLFDAAFYLKDNPDVRESGLPPFQHFIRHGAEEGRRPNADFDPDGNSGRYPDPRAGRYEAFVHFVQHGNASTGDVARQPPPAPVRAEGVVEVRRESGGGKHVGRPARSRWWSLFRRGDPPGQASGQVAVEAAGEVSDEVAGEDRGQPLACEGFLDALHGRVAHGWAWLPDAPERIVDIEILDDDRIVGRGSADVYREDLEANGFGDGRHGFQLRLSRELDDGQPHRLKAQIAGSGQVLQGEVAYRAEQTPDVQYDPLGRREVAQAAQRIAGGLSSADGRAFVESASRAQFLVETDDFDAALAEINAATDRFPANALLPLQAAEARIGLDQPDLAIADCRRAVELAGEGEWTARCWLQLGNASRMLGQWQEAEAAFNQALVHDPGLAPARRRLAEVHARKQSLEARRCLGEGDADAALQLMVPQLIRHPGDEGLQRLVLRALAAGRGAGSHMDAGIRHEVEAVQLLGAVVEHVRARGSAA